MAITATLTGTSVPYQTATLSISGLANTTMYVQTTLNADGSTSTYRFTSDGSGNATVKYVPQLKGSVTHSIRPASECNCSTVASGTLTTTH